ncbi:hypothetical protein LTR56_015163 [Elasticomyces elasticus]|nr:hypothetical protein LTR56_015163 [Elasticomyces elasticus]KAK3644457.1 hypothetical protein LTR22_015177 [Elasticomyces elasticus]KAK4915493.1 hypothetical protein LTR49_016340 [Elasticomyces elasticus]KAK5756211.1 hypothetical protein LTS12_013635 [Elasticomyces elasticus]
MAPKSTANELTLDSITHSKAATITRAFSKSLRRNATVSAPHPLTQPPTQPQSIHPQPTHSLQTQDFQALSVNYIAQRLQLQNTHLALLAKDREISNLHYWLNGRGQQTGDLVFRIGELMKMGEEAESEIVELEKELDELKEGLAKAVKEVLRLREVVERKDVKKARLDENTLPADAEDRGSGGGDAEVDRLKSAVDAARLHLQYQDQHVKELEGRIKGDGKEILGLEKDRDETWRYAMGVEEDLKIAESENEALKAENEELKEENEVLKVKWEVGSEEYLKSRKECDRERKARLRTEKMLAKRMGRRVVAAVLSGPVEEEDGWEDCA